MSRTRTTGKASEKENLFRARTVRKEREETHDGTEADEAEKG